MKDISTHFFLVVLLLSSILLISFSLPRLLAGIKMTYPDTVYHQLRVSKTIPNEILVKAIIEAEDALSWENSSFTWSLIAYYSHKLIDSHQYSVEENLELASVAKSAYINSLSLSAVEPYVWYRLAIIHLILDKQDSEVVNFLKLSMYSGRVEPNLAVLRLYFLTRYLDSSGDELMSLVKDQVRLVWLFNQQELVNLILTTPALKPVVYDALNSDDILKFNQRLDKTIQKNNRSK